MTFISLKDIGGETSIQRIILFLLLLLLACSLPSVAQQANVNLDHNPHQNTERLIPFREHVIPLAAMTGPPGVICFTTAFYPTYGKNKQ